MSKKKGKNNISKMVHKMHTLIHPLRDRKYAIRNFKNFAEAMLMVVHLKIDEKLK